MNSIIKSYTPQRTNNMDDKKAAIARLEAYRSAYLDIISEDNFDLELWNSVDIVDANVNSNTRTGSALYSLVVPIGYCNFTGNVMGGAVATILDGLTNCSIALLATDGFWDMSGVTSNLTISFLRPVKKDERLLVECEILRMSSQVAVIGGKIRRATDGILLAHGTQEMMAIRAKL